MVRFALGLVATALCLGALETPLTLHGANRVVTIDPSFGGIALYETSASSTVRQGLKGSANFLKDLDLKAKSPIAERNGVVFSWLRVGSPNNKPSPEEVLALLPRKPSESDKQQGRPALQTWARRGEDEFWKTEPAYDGIIRASLSQGGRYLAVVAPSLHALLLYQIDGDEVKLEAWRNYGPELYIPNGLNSTPDANALLRELPADKRKEALEALGMGAPENEGKRDAAPADDATGIAVPPTPKSDPWLVAGPQDSFLLVDPLNTRAMLYQFNGKLLNVVSVRNLALDLRVPSLIGNSFNANPSEQALLDAWTKSRATYIKQYSLLVDRDNVAALVGQRGDATKGKASPFEGVISGTGIAFLNFLDRRVFLTLDLRGGQSLALVSARDTTLDTGLMLLDQEIKDRLSAREALGDVRSLLGQRLPRTALLALKLALGLDPFLGKDAEKLKNDFKGELQADYQALLDEATKKADELKAQAEARRKLVEEKQKQRQK